MTDTVAETSRSKRQAETGVRRNAANPRHCLVSRDTASDTRTEFSADTFHPIPRDGTVRRWRANA